MCLDSVKKIYTGKSTKIQTGYKVFYSNAPHASVHGKHKGGTYNFREWYQAKNENYGYDPNRPIKTSDGTMYPPGFHIFATKADVRKYFGVRDFSGHGETLRKVYYKGLLARGKDCGANVIIAKHMSVGRPRKEKKCSTTTQRQKASY